MTDISKPITGGQNVALRRDDPGILSPARRVSDLCGADHPDQLVLQSRQHPQRPASGESAVLHCVGPDAGGADRWPRPFDWCQCRYFRLYCRNGDSSDGLADLGGTDRHRRRWRGGDAERRDGHGASNPILHCDLRDAVGAARHHLLVHGRRDHARLPGWLSSDRQRLFSRSSDPGLSVAGLPRHRNHFRAAHHVGTGNLMPSAPTRSPRDCRAFPPLAGFCWSTQCRAQWPGSPRSSFLRD